MKDPDPTSVDYMYDEIDKFHLSKDKILLDITEEKKDESELEENLDEEVLALQGVSSSDEYSDVDEEDREEENKNRDSEDGEVSSGDDLEKDLPSDKAWGRNKKAFYDADVQDDDIYTSDEEGEIAAEEEEKEAMILQKRLAEQLDTEDFYTFNEVREQEVPSKISVPKDLSKLSKRERLEILAEESPELLPLLDEYKDKFCELRDKYHPLMLMARKGLIVNPNGVKFIEIKHQLLLNYLVNITFYLVLKSSKENTKGHPVIDVLVQHQHIFSQMNELDENVESEIEGFLAKYKEHIKAGFTDPIIKDNKRKSQPKAMHDFKENTLKCQKVEKVSDSTMDPLAYYNLVKAQHQKEKNVKKQKLSVEKDNIEENEDDENGKRMITYEMSKNKGLIRKRRKELKNPRVKHKMKFKKAIIKRKGQVLNVQREMNRYGGEGTGIKSTLTRSTKIK